MQDTKDSSTLLLYVLGALLVIMGGAWLFLSTRGAPQRDADSTPLAPAVTQSLPVVEHNLQENLELGALALNAGQLVTPADGSALYFYLSAREQDADNEAVARGLEQLAQQIGVRARVQLTQQDFPALVTSIQAMEAIDIGDERLLAVRNDLGLLVDSKIALVDAATRRGQWDAATALLDELAALPSVDADVMAQRRQSLADARQRADDLAVTVAVEAAALAAQAAQAAQVTPVVTGDADAAPAQDAAQPPAQDAATTVAGAATTVAAVDGGGDAAGEVDAGGSAGNSAAGGAAGDGSDADTIQVALLDAAELENEEEDDAAIVAALLSNVRASLDAGRLTTPITDSASYYLREVQRVEPDNPRLTSGLIELVRALTQRALGSARDGQWNDADQSLAEAESFGVANQVVNGAREQILTERINQESARLVPVGELQNLKVVQPRYPNRALRNNAEGWVVVNFTVQPDGKTADVTAVETSDRYGNQFGRAAEVAVSKWEFVPRVFLGQTIPQRVQARVTFQIGD